MATFTPYLGSWIWYSDGAWQTQETAITGLANGAPVRLRLCVHEAGGKSGSNKDVQLIYSTNADLSSPSNFGTPTGTGSVFRWRDDAGLTEHAAISGTQLSCRTESGVTHEATCTNSEAIGASAHHELEVVFEPYSMASGTTYYIGLVLEGATLAKDAEISAYPSVTAIATYTKTFTAGANLQKNLTKTFTAGANLQKNLSKTFTVGGNLQKNLTKTFTVGANLDAGTVTDWSDDLDPDDYTVTMPATYETGGVTYYFSKWEDDSTNRVRNITLSADTTLTAYYVTHQTKGFTTGAQLQRNYTKQFTAGAQLTRNLTKGFTVGGNLQKQLTLTFTVGAQLTRNLTKGFTVGAYLQKNISIGFTVGANLQKPATKGFTVGAQLTQKQNKGFTVGATLDKLTTAMLGGGSGPRYKRYPLTLEQAKLLKLYLELKLEDAGT